MDSTLHSPGRKRSKLPSPAPNSKQSCRDLKPSPVPISKQLPSPVPHIKDAAKLHFKLTDTMKGDGRPKEGGEGRRDAEKGRIEEEKGRKEEERSRPQASKSVVRKNIEAPGSSGQSSFHCRGV